MDCYKAGSYLTATSRFKTLVAAVGVANLANVALNNVLINGVQALSIPAMVGRCCCGSNPGCKRC